MYIIDFGKAKEIIEQKSIVNYMQVPKFYGVHSDGRATSEYEMCVGLENILKLSKIWGSVRQLRESCNGSF